MDGRDKPDHDNAFDSIDAGGVLGRIGPVVQHHNVLGLGEE